MHASITSQVKAYEELLILKNFSTATRSMYLRTLNLFSGSASANSPVILAAIHQFMQHVLPPYFQKSRHQGIHSSVTYKRIKDEIPRKLKRNGKTVRVIFQILNHLNGLEGPKCEHCQHDEFEIMPLGADVKWIFNFITLPSYRGPPKKRGLASLEF